jgi:hypothetical protein
MEGWKKIQLFVPSRLSSSEVRDDVQSAICVNASEAGEFVTQIRIDAGVPHSEGWRRWSAYYLTGPPGLFDRIIAYPLFGPTS